jgi:hypothetical protein
MSNFIRRSATVIAARLDNPSFFALASFRRLAKGSGGANLYRSRGGEVQAGDLAAAAIWARQDLILAGHIDILFLDLKNP